MKDDDKEGGEAWVASCEPTDWERKGDPPREGTEDAKGDWWELATPRTPPPPG